MQLVQLLPPGVSLLALVWLAVDAAFLTALLLYLQRGCDSGRSLLCSVFQDLIRYGKTKSGLRRPSWLQWFDIPKRCFWHFYFVSLVWNGFLLWILLHLLLQSVPVPEWLQAVLQFLCAGSEPQVLGGELSVVLAFSLLWLHSLRRLLECLFVSIFSNGVIHFVQYCFGLGYYILIGFTILGYCPLDRRTAVSLDDLLMQGNWYHILGLTLYVWASLHQYTCHCILADLRKSASGAIINLKHAVPTGDWFEKVSCPHYFAELLIYLSIAVVFGLLNTIWWLVVLYVLLSQALAAVLCHEFYHEKFDSYPIHRKAFIPLIF
ncbi:polyprenol reductase [Xenopus laevis]|uniref:Polyprenal reductase n=1 Tax=Xenopus laevis TaxID=8355 RepID=SR5A3_XENLA|nr:polyprenol reductase [Xenopus laevis]Q8AVI9.1 RecName: Full=Polyprenol reductase; AltName: Full=3-oxo-5-alpha-steroid 4-dehydrogenase 3; AltName: Full=Steroid 5-alpha-reductase 3; Short=S5AR 3; Short=SR type 3 [Xenopus laevis]AAH42255.1 Srd5a3 protein [Xenopus laevis]